MKQKRLLILDRDGVINEDSDDYIKNAEEWVPIPGSIDAIASASKAGFVVAVATNQSGLSRGLFDEVTLADMHEKMHSLVEEAGGKIDGIFLCPHLPSDDCDCRKPRTGLLEKIAEEFHLPLDEAWFIGDSEKDIDCALAMQCQPVLVFTGKGLGTRAKLTKEKAGRCYQFSDLQQAINALLHLSANNT